MDAGLRLFPALEVSSCPQPSHSTGLRVSSPGPLAALRLGGTSLVGVLVQREQKHLGAAELGCAHAFLLWEPLPSAAGL